MRDLTIVVGMYCLIMAVGMGTGIIAGYNFGRDDCLDTAEQTRTREVQWAKQLQEFRGRAFRAEQATAEAMMEAARLRDKLKPWDNGFYMLVERGTAPWAAAKRAMDSVDNSVLAVEAGMVR